MITDLPDLHLDHIVRLTDSTGIYQHATYSIPNRHEGYCLDDNARALLLMLMVSRHVDNTIAKQYIPLYFSYVFHAQNDDGTFRNFMNFQRAFLDEKGTDDAFGRAIWALGYTVAHSPIKSYRPLAHQLIKRAEPHFMKIMSIRSIATIILGLYHFLDADPSNHRTRYLITVLANKLRTEYQASRDHNWHWYESLLAYDNALLPLAMLCAAKVTNDTQTRNTAYESMAFLKRHTLREERVSLVGNLGWYRKGEPMPAQFAQQPVDAMAMVLMYKQAYDDTGDKQFLGLMSRCFRWFLGENDLGQPLYDPETKGCCDGLQEDGVNQNQGAESTLAFWIARLTLQTYI